MKFFTLILFSCFALYGFGRGGGGEKRLNNHSVVFVQPEILIGKTLPGNSNFPETRLHTVYALSVGKFVLNPDRSWAQFYNYPQLGVTVSKSSFGNDQILGNAYTLMPFISINTSKKLRNSFHVRTGLGASYFTKTFHKSENPSNLAIGSTITWTFQLAMNYTFVLTRNFTLNAGVAYIHHSNGHTQLPNLGLNSFLFSISSNIFLSPLKDVHMEAYEKTKSKKTKQYFIETRTGIGMHEIGGPNSAVERLKKAVFSLAVGGGMILNRNIKFKAGLMYRFYHHYYNYITRFNTELYEQSPVLNSSNLVIYAGCEFLIGHVGLDVEVGINIFKPFYKEHSYLFEDDTDLSYTLKRIFASRLGLKFYALSTAKNPRNNVFIGAHINANLGQADFSEISIGFVHRFKKINTKN